MANAITAKLGIDLGPLQKGLKEAQKLESAAAKKSLAEGKKGASEARTAVGSVVGSLVRADNISSAFALSAEKLGDALGFAGVGVAVGFVAEKLGEAAEEARKFHKELNATFGTQQSSGFASLPTIQGHFQKLLSLSDEITQSMENPSFGKEMGEAVNKLSVGDFTGAADPFLGGKSKISGKNADLNQISRSAQGDLDRMIEKEKAITRLEEMRFSLGEKQAALESIRVSTNEKLGELILMQAEAGQKGVQLDISGAYKAAKEEGEERLHLLNEIADRQKHIADDAVEDARAQAAAEAAGFSSRLDQANQEVEILNKQIERKRELARESKAGGEQEERFNREADALAVQRDAKEREAFHARVARDNAEQDLQRAREQSAINLLGMTDKKAASERQIALWQKEIAQNQERESNASEDQLRDLQKQNLTLEEQIKKEAMHRAAMTANEKRQELRDKHRSTRLEHRAERDLARLHARPIHGAREIPGGAFAPLKAAVQAGLEACGVTGAGIARAVVGEVIKAR